MGRDDLYPFTLSPAVVEKLSFVHERVLAVAAPPGPEEAQRTPRASELPGSPGEPHGSPGSRLAVS